MWLRLKNHPANIIIRHLSDRQIQLRPSDIKEISSYCFFFLLLVFIPCSHSSIHGSNFSPCWCWAKALLICPLPASQNTNCTASAAWVQVKFCITPAYTMNLKWQIREVRAFNQAGAERKRHSKRAEIILWLVKMSWWESSEWLQMSSQKKKKSWLGYNSLDCVFPHARLCACALKKNVAINLNGGQRVESLRLENIII